jgi:hypothetical protein
MSACVIAGRFPAGVRCSGFAMALNTGIAASSGTAPLIAGRLIAKTR